MDVMEKTLGEIFRPVEPDARVVVVPKEALTPGVLARYIGTKQVKTARGARESNTLHTFATVDAPEDRAFAVWGTGQLNQQLAKVTPGALLFLGYLGKVTPDDGSGVAVHRWAVNVANRPLDKIPAEFRDGLKPVAEMLICAIDEAAFFEAKRFADRVAKGQPGASPDDEYAQSWEHFPG